LLMIEEQPESRTSPPPSPGCHYPGSKRDNIRRRLDCNLVGCAGAGGGGWGGHKATNDDLREWEGVA
jgi:hypothetical protein